MKVYNKDVNFSITNIDDAKNFELAIQNLKKNEKTVKEIAGLVREGKAKLFDLMETQMRMFRAFFKECTGEDVLVDCRDLAVAKAEYSSFMDSLQEQIANYTSNVNEPVITPVVNNILGNINV